MPWLCLQFDFSGCEIISYTKAAEVNKQREILIYGAPADVEPFQNEPLNFHYVNNAPFAVGTTVEKKVDVGRWGTLHVDERYQLVWTSLVSPE